MIRTRLACLLFLALLGFSSLFPCHAATVEVEVIHSQDRYGPGKSYPLLLRLKVVTPWYIHGAKEGEDPIIPTVMRFRDVPGVTVERIQFPRPSRVKFDYAPRPVEVFSGEVMVSASLRVDDRAPPGEHVVAGELSYQACSPDSCLPPEGIPVPVRVSIAAPGASFSRINQDLFVPKTARQGTEEGIPGFRPGAGFWLTLLALFLGGLALNLTPCIYPLIPITVSYFTARTEKRTVPSILQALLYMIGLAATNAVLGLFAALSGGMLGAALQSTFVLLGVALVLILMATSFFGFWDLRLPAGFTRFASRNYGGYLGSLFMGLTLGIVAAPCIGPFVLGLLTYVAQKGDPFLGFLYFFVLSIGLGLPLALLALFSGALQRLPLSGDWMLWVRKLMGWVLLGMASHIVGPLIPSSMGKAGLLAAVAAAAAVHLGWIDRTGLLHTRFLLFKKGLGIALLLGACLILVYTGYEREGIRWIPYDEALLAKAAKERRPVMLDFYADWCIPCRELEKHVFTDPEVVQLSRPFLTLRLDLTTRKDSQQQILSRYAIRGVPTVVFLDAEGREQKGLRIESLVEKEEFIRRARDLLMRHPKG
ncbi:MAG: thioredoxin family protein [Deltaproteobacteria bacterium]|nr:thioredoxin family protein [Deltaproteobacteria bacterium]